MSRKSGRSSRLSGAVLLMAGLVIGAVTIVPVGAHVTENVRHSIKQHGKRFFHLKQKVFTKAESNARFIQAGGDAGGALAGTYPDPAIADEAVTAPMLGAIITRAGSASVPSGELRAIVVGCQAGQKLISGGGGWTTPGGGLFLHSSRRETENGWLVRGENTSGSPRTLEAEAYCLVP